MYIPPIHKSVILRFRYTFTSIFTGILLLFLSAQYNIGFQNISIFTEILSCIFIVCCGLIIDLIIIIKNRKNLPELKKSEQVKVMQATMTTVQDIVNNSFNSLQIIRVKAETGEQITKEDINTFDYIIQNTSQKINNIKSYNEVDFVKITTEHTGIKVQNL